MAGKFLIYGGYGAIGSATARILSARGDTIHLVGRNEAKLTALATDLGAGYTVGDINETDLFARASSDAGEVLEGLVYAVGSINLRGLQRLSETDFLTDFRVNALGAALAVQAALPMLKKSGEGASVLFYSSVAALQGFAFHASVGMAKGAVSGLTLSLAAELAPKIRVNAIAPSLTRTPLADGILANEKLVADIAGLHPLQRLGEPEDIAALSAFLLSPQASWITGQIISVDGGLSTLRVKG
jgi:NAD(P)-dependent dehydrogenase (short-subunit alcohol dehydrogenase family)